MRELFLFDPYGEYLQPRLQGYRLVGGIYQPSEEYPLRSDILGLELREEDNALRLYHPTTGKRLLTAEEADLARRTAEEQRAIEAKARLEAEARAAEQTARAAEQTARAAEQTARAEAAEAELARLRALLGQKDG